MPPAISPRIAAFVQALPLKKKMRVLEIGCGPGAAAREVARIIGDGYVLAIDRSQKAIALAIKGSTAEIPAGTLEFRCVAAADFQLLPDEARFDLAFAMRVGALDGRHPQTGRLALARIKAALKPQGRLFIDAGSPLREISL
jgi:SAM-dependent methyltransferase